MNQADNCKTYFNFSCNLLFSIIGIYCTNIPLESILENPTWDQNSINCKKEIDVGILERRSDVIQIIVFLSKSYMGLIPT